MDSLTLAPRLKYMMKIKRTCPQQTIIIRLKPFSSMTLSYQYEIYSRQGSIEGVISRYGLILSHNLWDSSSKILGIRLEVFKKMNTYGIYHSAWSGSININDNAWTNVDGTYIDAYSFPKGLDDEGPNPMLKLRILGGSNNGEIYEFQVKQKKNGQLEIIMGRTPEYGIQINEKLLSKS
jgi:hypothetical protein